MDSSPPTGAPISQRERTPLLRIKSLLRASDDTSRILGLTLLKETVENSPELQNDKVQLGTLWDHISPRFLDRLLLSGTRGEADQDHARNMLNFAVNTIRAFTILQPKFAIGTSYFERIPSLTAALSYSSHETAENIVQIMFKLVHEPPTIKHHRGAIFVAKLGVDVWTRLIMITPDHPDVFSVFQWVWLKGTANLEDQREKKKMSDKIDQGLQAFVSLERCPPADLLAFVADILRGLEPDLIPPHPQWLESVVKLVKNLAAGKQSEAERCAYTNCAATLLQVYPHQAPQLLFSDDPASSKPFAYLLVTMLQVDFHATVHRLFSITADPGYPKISKRLASALEVVTAFVGHLIGSIDDEDMSKSAKTSQKMRLTLSPEHILKIRMDIARTIAEAMEYLRDRSDAVFLAELGHGSKEIAACQDPSGQGQKKLAWDVAKYNFLEDPITPAAIRLIAIWLRDDDGEELRKQGAGLMDMFVDIYEKNTHPRMETQNIPELRMPILSALEGVLETKRGIEMADTHSLWSVLSEDLMNILIESAKRKPLAPVDYMRGSFVCHALQTLLNQEGTTRLSWMPVADSVASYIPPPVDPDASDELVKAILEFQMDALQIAVDLLRKVSPNIRTINKKTVEFLKNVAEDITERWEETGNETLRIVRDEARSL
ncbi:Neurochondrin-domain-containing protein [Biscogniauxia mediterranea]|nr:Neurochondrin-domain-containing protein [Biscogniauxia mediterranea]